MSERIVTDPSQHGWVEVDGKWVWDASGGGAGAGMVISETEPADKVEGMQWLNPTTGLVLFWDDEKWLQMPGGKDGANGKDGADGADGLWTDNGDGSITYHNVTIADNDMMAIGRTPTDNGMFQLNVVSGGNCNIAMGEGGTEKWFFGNTSGSDTFRFYNVAASKNIMTIDADGWVNMANNQIDVGIANGNEPTISFKQAGGATRFQFLMNPNNFGFYIWDPVLSQSRMQLDNSGNLYAYGNIYKNNSTPVIATSDMVRAFSKLRDAVKDEETVESLKESITNWIGGMIEEWESMQSAATQEIPNE